MIYDYPSPVHGLVPLAPSRREGEYNLVLSEQHYNNGRILPEITLYELIVCLSSWKLLEKLEILVFANILRSLSYF